MTAPANLKPYMLKAVPSDGSEKVFENQKGFWFSHYRMYGYLKFCKFGTYDINGKKILFWSFNLRNGDSYTNVINVTNLKQDLVPFFQKWESLAGLTEAQIMALPTETIELIKAELLVLQTKHTQ